MPTPLKRFQYRCPASHAGTRQPQPHRAQVFAVSVNPFLRSILYCHPRPQVTCTLAGKTGDVLEYSPYI